LRIRNSIQGFTTTDYRHPGIPPHSRLAQTLIDANGNRTKIYCD